jgi:hypothetical protein
MKTAENKKEDKKSNAAWSQILLGVVIGVVSGTILGVGGTIFNQHGKIERMTEQINQLEKQLAVSEKSSKPIENSSEYTVTEVRPSNLEEVIKNQQKSNVKASHSEHNCFTSKDLEMFKNQKKHNQIVADLMNDNSFIDLIISIKNMTPTERQALLSRCANISKPTWNSLGEISSKGQTDAGNEAELLIAEAIVAKVKEVSGLPLEEIKKLYK